MCNSEFEVPIKNKQLKYCTNCRDSKSRYKNYTNIYKDLINKLRTKLLYLKISTTGNIGNRIKYEKILDLNHGIKSIQKKENYLKLIETIQKELEEEKENIKNNW